MSGDGDDAVSFLYLIGCFVLVLSALLAQRIPIRQGLKIGAAWVLIFLAVFVGFTLKDDFAALGRRVFTGDKGQTVQGNGLRIRKSDDGHFWVTAKVNGRNVRFLIDSGATNTALSADTAEAAGVEQSDGFPIGVETANGLVMARRGQIGSLEVGPIKRRELAVLVSKAFGPTDVLGMNFLSSLSRWEVEGDWLLLKP